MWWGVGWVQSLQVATFHSDLVRYEATFKLTLVDTSAIAVVRCFLFLYDNRHDNNDDQDNDTSDDEKSHFHVLKLYSTQPYF